jgi:predicted metal-dependent phosphoesterase TrpH
MCLKAVEAGLAGIALTEHDVWWPAAELKRLQERFSELTILRGREYFCPEGHFLVFLPDPDTAKLPVWCSVLKLITAVHNNGGVVIWAHPFRFKNSRPMWLDRMRPDGMEVASSNMEQRAQTMATQVAAAEGIVMFRNSDAHHASILGRYANELDTSLSCVEDFISYVRKQTYADARRGASHMGAALPSARRSFRAGG